MEGRKSIISGLAPSFLRTFFVLHLHFWAVSKLGGNIRFLLFNVSAVEVPLDGNYRHDRFFSPLFSLTHPTLGFIGACAYILPPFSPKVQSSS